MRPSAVVYRTLTAVLAVVGVARVIGVGSPELQLGGLLYYTSLSNLLGAAWMLVALVVTLRRVVHQGWQGRASVLPRLGAGVALAILVTMLIYLTVLAPAAFTQGSGYQPFTLTDDLVHVIVPLLVIGDWVIFADKGRLRWWDPLWWAGIPYAYVVFAMLRPLATDAPWPGGGTYPYPFLDVDALGAGGVIAGLAVLTVVIEGIAVGIVAVDHLWARRQEKGASS